MEPLNDTDQHPLSAGHPQGATTFERVDHDDSYTWRRLRSHILDDAEGRRADDIEEAGPMMSGCVDHPLRFASPKPRLYEVVARAGGWSISPNGACTRPFRSRRAAERIANASTSGRRPDRQAETTRHHHA